MTFLNQKKTFLAKMDQSKKGFIDTKVIPLLNTINKLDNYYTTSSCSGRVYFWRGTYKKNETEWIKTSHDLITEDFFNLEDTSGLIWLRLEGFIIHICCKTLEDAKELLDLAKVLYKKSCILSLRNKIIVEIRGPEMMEMPYYQDGELVFSGSQEWLLKHINSKLEQVWNKTEEFRKLILKS